MEENEKSHGLKMEIVIGFVSGEKTSDDKSGVARILRCPIRVLNQERSRGKDLILIFGEMKRRQFLKTRSHLKKTKNLL